MSASAADLLAAALPAIPLDRGVQRAVRGVLVLDALPLVTLLPCLPTLALFMRRRMLADVALFGFGFAVAVAYHVAHMHPDGLDGSVLLGLPGVAWRTLDILVCHALLSRTVAHAVRPRTRVVWGVANLGFPAAIAGWIVAAALDLAPRLTLGLVSRVLAAFVGATLAAKGGLEGALLAVAGGRARRARRAGVCFLAGLAVFPIPELKPELYVFCHSAWHLLMARGYREMFELDEEAAAREAKRRAKKAA